MTKLSGLTRTAVLAGILDGAHDGFNGIGDEPDDVIWPGRMPAMQPPGWTGPLVGFAKRVEMGNAGSTTDALDRILGIFRPVSKGTASDEYALLVFDTGLWLPWHDLYNVVLQHGDDLDELLRRPSPHDRGFMPALLSFDYNPRSIFGDEEDAPFKLEVLKP